MSPVTVTSVLVAILLIVQCLAHPHPSGEELQADRRQRKRLENAERRSRGEMTERELRNRRERNKQNVPEVKESESARGIVEVEVDPDIVVSRYVVREPMYTEYTMDEMTSEERRSRHIMMKRRMMLRLFQIQQRILTELGMPHPPVVNVSMPELENLRDFYKPMINSDRVPEQADNQDLYALMATCKGPHNSHKSTWEDQGLDMRLYFPVNSTAHRFRRSEVHSAILRLYMPSDEIEETWEDANDTTVTTEAPIEEVTEQPPPRRSPALRDQPRGHHHRQPPVTTSIPLEPLGKTEEWEGQGNADSYNVTVYQYIRALRKNKKEKLEVVASVLVSKNHTGWVRIAMKDVADQWMVNPKKNFGLKVTVEDADGNRLNFRDIFHATNCSADPNQTMEINYALAGAFDLEGDNTTGGATAEHQAATFPTLDLVTVNAEPEEDSEFAPASFRLRQHHIQRRNAAETHRRAEARRNTLYSSRHSTSTSLRIAPRMPGTTWR